ncbi:pickpocket protein 28-like [Atheta coriaria]|uniref:pickpocket protein 28-like n=1 Tax=Dalotia coriaria TaxID=877792 RepID=UPI0031F453AA
MDVEAPKKRSRKLSKKDRKRMSNYFTEYCDATSIHGFRYLGEQKRSCLEKLWWFVTIFVSVCICTYLIVQTYHKWDRSPVIVSFATKQTPIWQIPFPAVTICPETKSRQSVFNFTESYLKDFDTLNAKERMELEHISMICKPRKLLKSKKLKSMQVNESILNFFDEIAPGIANMTIKFVWMGEKIDYSAVFTPILTDTGICYTFNMLDRRELFNPVIKPFKNYLHHDRSAQGHWSLENGYSKDEEKDTFPRRALFSGAKNGMDITLVTYDKDVDYICGDALQGYKILLHHPAEIPRVSQQYFWAPLNQAVIAAIKPDMMTTSDELRTYPPNKRQCYFPSEHSLRFFTVYTQQNCEIECLANYTYQLCGCVAFYMPRAADTPICGPGNLLCMKQAETKLLSGEIDIRLKELKEEQQNNTEPFQGLMKGIEGITTKISEIGGKPAESKPKAEKRTDQSNCKCLQSCTSLSYSVETSQSDWDWVQHYIGLNDPYGFVAANVKNGTRLAHLSRIVLFFKDMQFIASERDELYGHIDFLANCGGLLGLFTGFSFISLVEVIYFLSLRLLCNMKNKAKKRLNGE